MASSDPCSAFDVSFNACVSSFFSPPSLDGADIDITLGPSSFFYSDILSACHSASEFDPNSNNPAMLSTSLSSKQPAEQSISSYDSIYEGFQFPTAAPSALASSLSFTSLGSRFFIHDEVMFSPAEMNSLPTVTRKRSKKKAAKQPPVASSAETECDVWSSLYEKVKAGIYFGPSKNRSWDAVYGTPTYQKKVLAPQDFDKQYQKHFSSLVHTPAQIISESDLVRNCLLLLQGHASTSFAFRESSESFEITSPFRLANRGAVSMHPCISHFMACGTVAYRLRAFANEGKEDASKAGLVMQAFCLAVHSYLLQYEAFITQTAVIVSRNGYRQRLQRAHSLGESDVACSVLELATSVRWLLRQLLFMADLCQVSDSARKFQFKLPRGSHLVSYLYTAASSTENDRYNGQLTRMLFQKTCVPYLAMVNSWIYQGSVHDPYNEFVDVKRDSYDKLYLDDFTSVRRTVPIFLQQCLEQLVRCGQSLHILKLSFNSKKPSVSVTSQALRDETILFFEELFSIGQEDVMSVDILYELAEIERVRIGRKLIESNSSYRYNRLLEAVESAEADEADAHMALVSKSIQQQTESLQARRRFHADLETELRKQKEQFKLELDQQISLKSNMEQQLKVKLAEEEDNRRIKDESIRKRAEDQAKARLLAEYADRDRALQKRLEIAKWKAERELLRDKRKFFIESIHLAEQQALELLVDAESALPGSLQSWGAPVNPFQLVAAEAESTSTLIESTQQDLPQAEKEVSDLDQFESESISEPALELTSSEVVVTEPLASDSTPEPTVTADVFSSSRSVTSESLDQMAAGVSTSIQVSSQRLGKKILQPPGGFTSEQGRTASKRAVVATEDAHAVVRSIIIDLVFDSISVIDSKHTVTNPIHAVESSSSFLDLNRSTNSLSLFFTPEMDLLSFLSSPDSIVESSLPQLPSKPEKAHAIEPAPAPVHESSVDGSTTDALGTATPQQLRLMMSDSSDEPIDEPGSTQAPSESQQLIRPLNHVDASGVLLPLPWVVQCCVIDSISEQCKLVNRAVYYLFIHELKLLSHLSALRQYLFMQAGDRLDNFVTRLFSNPLPDVDWTSEANLDSAFESSVKASGPDHDSYAERFHFRTIRRTDSYPDLSSIEAFDFARLEYKADWPLNIVITSDCISKYNTVFSVLLKIRRVSHALTDMWSFFKHPTIRKLRGEADRHVRHMQLLRQEMHHFVTILQGYLVTQVLDISWSQLKLDLENAKDLVSIQKAHAVYLERCMARCFLTPKAAPVMENIKQMFVLILKFKSHIQQSDVNDFASVKSQRSFNGIRDGYRRYNRFLYKILTKLAERGHYEDLLLRLNFNDFHAADLAAEQAKDRTKNMPPIRGNV